MTHELEWAQPNPSALLEPGEPPVPDTESLLAEVGSSYPVVTYPAAQATAQPEEAVDQAIFAGLVWP
jgi:hypothetical protein